MLCFLVAVLLLTSISGLPLAQTLDIYFIDVEGGAATLIVTPERESVLVDSGWRRVDGRDAKRIHRLATEQAGITQIDYLITTHYHRDHYGGVGLLSGMLPIQNFLDHGPVSSLKEDREFQFYYTEYVRASRGQRQRIRPGDIVPLKQGRIPLTLLCLASRGEVIKEEGSRNPECEKLQLHKDDPSDNARSVCLLLRFGNFQFLDCGDLTWNAESELVCPTDRIGPIDAYQVTHHGLSLSNNDVLLRTVRPSAAIINNGPHKGPAPEVMGTLRSLPTLQDIFQLHLNLKTDAEENTETELIANLEPEERCGGHWVHLSVRSDAGNFTVTNSRNGVIRSYAVK